LAPNRIRKKGFHFGPTIAVKRFDGFAALSFALAFFIMVIPVEADLLMAFAVERRAVMCSLLAIACFMVVGAPFAISLHRHWRLPGVWRGEAYLGGTTLILLFNILMIAGVLFKQIAG
jgi:hypothetical protein